MRKYLIFNKNYFIVTFILFIIELLIAFYLHDKIIRPYIGDLLVVILIYTFVKSFLKIGVNKLAFYVLIFAFVIEWLQYINFITLIGLQNNQLAKIVFGNSFEWIDIAAYIGGIAIVLLVERFIKKFIVIR
ncbi:MAG: DUF2809 domain-containing protein [Bacteroidota bacterium]